MQYQEGRASSIRRGLGSVTTECNVLERLRFQ